MKTKTFTIDEQRSPASGRILSVRLMRYGKCFASRRVLNDSEAVSAYWEMRREAKTLGASHVILANTGARESVDA